MIEPTVPCIGAIDTIKSGSLRSLIELSTNSAADMAVPDLLAQHEFKRVSMRSNWDSWNDKTRAVDLPVLNMIFARY